MNFSIVVARTPYRDFYLAECWAADAAHPKYGGCFSRELAQREFADAVARVQRYGRHEDKT